MIPPKQSAVFGDVTKNWGWLLALGAAFIILGTIGLGITAFLTIVSVLFFGFFLISGGVMQLVQSISSRGWKSNVWHVIIAIAYIAAGVITVANPVGGAMALTIFLAIALFGAGVMRIIMAFQMRGTSGWFWPIVSGIISLVLGGMIMAQWPSSALWIIGIIVAVEMIVHGWACVMIALAARGVGKVEEALKTANTPASV